MKALEKWKFLTLVIGRLNKQGSWTGETHIQKVAFFLKELLGLGKFRFVLYKYGPFSFDLRKSIAYLKALDLVRLELREPPYGSSLVLTERGRKLAEKLAREMDKRTLAKVDEIAKEFGNKTVSELERLSTALYLMGRNLNTEDAAKRLHELKPHISEGEALTACKAIERLLEQYPAHN